MTRIPLPSVDELAAEQRRVHDAIGALRKGHVPIHYRAALCNPELANRWQQIGELLRYRTSLPRRLSELAILVTARHHRCDYEWCMHEAVAIEAGIAQEIVQAIKAGKRPDFQASDELAVYDYCTNLLETMFVNETIYKAAIEIVGSTGIVELTALLGYYAMVAMSVNAHELPLPANAKPVFGLPG